MKNNDKLQSIFLNASAGSGKTFALCTRYIALLLHGINASEILTLTFTNKAANEMKERITNNLLALYHFSKYRIDDQTYHTFKCSSKSIEEFIAKSADIKKHRLSEKYINDALSLHKALSEYDLDLETINSKISNVYDNFLQSSKRISTIDSFLITMLRPFAFYAGVRSDFEVQESNKEEEFLQAFLESSYKDLELRKILQYIHQDLQIPIQKARYAKSLNLNELLIALHDKSIEFDLRGKSKNSLLEIMKEQQKEMLNDRVLLAKKCQIQDTLSLENLHSSEILSLVYKAANELAEYIEEIAPNAKSLSKTKDELKSNNINKILKSTIIKNGNHKSIKADDDKKAIVHKFCNLIKNRSILWNLTLEAERLITLGTLVKNYTESIGQVQKSNNELSFNAIKHKVFGLMNDVFCNNDEWHSDYFYFRLDSKIRHILFDEYQDTSIIQYRIFLPMFKEILAGSGTKDNRTLFFVGDSKQSMYAFRGANKIVFEQSKKNLKEEYLDYNYRSKPNIIDFVNERFCSLFENYIMQKYPMKTTNENDGDDNPNKNITKDGIVKINLYNHKDYYIEQDKNNPMHHSTLKSKQNEALRKHAFSEIKEVLQELLDHGVAQKDIALLARKRDILQEFVQWARSNISHVNFNLDKNGKLIEQRYIQIIYYTMLLHNYNERLSQIEEKSNAHQILKYKKFAQKTLNKLLNKSYEEDIALPNLHKKNLALQIKEIIESFRLYNEDSMLLLELACQSNTQDMQEFFNSIANKDSTLMQEEAVQTMTIHASKGLGFSYVIYLDLNIKSKKKAEKILYDYNGIYLKHIRLNHNEEVQDDVLANLTERTIQNMNSEEYNILYVACTRAKDGLYIFANDQSYSALTLNLDKSQSRGQNQPSIKESKENKNKPIIISSLPFKKIAQEEFLRHTEISYNMTMDLQHKQTLGIITHISLELMLGYKIKSIMPILFSQWGFHIKVEELEGIIQRVQRLINGDYKADLSFADGIIYCEIPILKVEDEQDSIEWQDGQIKESHIEELQNIRIINQNKKNNMRLALKQTKLQRIDAILQQGDSIFILEFKTSQKLNNNLIKEHAKQLKSYESFIKNITISQNLLLTIKSYIIYLQDYIIFQEI
ncbi:hypothetical protein LS73_008350 [Helicobacter muridarum]|uniref:DNA 3'-5' helicase n=1 Tax=Helicobacter muridarum TaxID=216 RepID=A0A099U2F1_9HELI|nr:UvrD-helicase domain-containing protein [Helicobacter muridarum]TLD98779.1 hypothetical protein LS73_008350 [Helicobacter muridarum]STQ85452.1 UvrD/REP family ATP-dependent DNA helicase [Helicobacter muridarum]